MKVVEEPFRGGSNESSVMHIVGENPVRGAQRAGVVIEAWEDAARALARGGVDREPRAQRQRAFFEALYSEQLVAKRSQATGRRAVTDWCEQSCLRFVLW
jgi:hypothetical protein